MSFNIQHLTVTYRTSLNGRRNSFAYKAFHIKKETNSNGRCLLILSGTSTQLADIGFFLKRLDGAGYSIASIERSIGGPFSFKMNPAAERKAALKDFIQVLLEDGGFTEIDIIAHSYASFEVIRLLTDAPAYYRECIQYVIFMNPAGFQARAKFVNHCLRFLFLFVTKEYFRCLANGFNKNSSHNEFYHRKRHGLNAIFLKTVQNPVRTFKEVADIVSFKVPLKLQALMKRYGFNFHFILNSEDELVLVSETLRFVKEVVPEERVMTLPGNHLDVILDAGQIMRILEYLERLRVEA